MSFPILSNDGDTRTRIFLAAAELFSNFGYDRVSIRQICEKVGVGKPTLYYYFTDKETLLTELLRFSFDISRGLLKKLLGPADSFRERFRALISFREQFAQKYPNFMRFFISMNILALPDPVRAEMVTYMKWAQRELEKMFVTAQTNGEINPKLNPKILNYAVIGAMNQVLIWNIFTDRKQLMSSHDSELLLAFWDECIFNQPQ